MNSSDLLYFVDPDEEFNAVHYQTNEDFSLELGNEFLEIADEEEEDYPSNNSYPSGRAFDWLCGTRLKFPDELGISLVDGACPGNDWRGVLAENYDSLKKLQDFLAANGFRVNFIIEFS